MNAADGPRVAFRRCSVCGQPRPKSLRGGAEHDRRYGCSARRAVRRWRRPRLGSILLLVAAVLITALIIVVAVA